MKSFSETPWMGVITPLGVGSFSGLIGLSLLAFPEATKGYNVWGLSLPFLLAALIFLSFAHYRFRENKEMYAVFYQAYPEAKGQLQILKNQATYPDNGLGIWIYKDFLVGRIGGLRLYPLKEVVWTYGHELGFTNGFFTGRMESSLMLGVKIRQRHLLKQILLAKTVQAQEERDKLLAYIEANYPQIMIGYTNANNHFFGILREDDKKKPKRFWDILF